MAKTFEALQRAERQFQALRQQRETVPRISTSPEIISVVSPGGWQKLHHELSIRNRNQRLRRIMFTGVNPGVGVTHSAVQFGWTMVTASGCKVLLIDANLQTPRLNRIFNIKPSVGFSDLLVPDGTKKFNFIMTGKKDLYTFPSGRFYPDGVRDFKSRRLDTLFKVAGKKFDYIVLDSAPITKSSESRSLCDRVDGVLLVIEGGKTGRQFVAAAKKEIEAAGGKLLGVVLNKR